MTDSDFLQILNNQNSCFVKIPVNLTLAKTLREEYKNHHDAVALKYRNTELTYHQFSAYVSGLASKIFSAVGEKQRIAVFFDRSIEMVLSLHSIIQSGNNYIPIGLDWPKGRISTVLKDVDPSIILTNKKTESQMFEEICPIWVIDDYSEIQMDAKLPELSITGNDTAYIIYTSGSTGNPKGAELPHSGLLNRLFWMQGHYNISVNDKILQKTPYTFDVSVWEFFLPFISGSSLVILEPESHKDPRIVKDVIYRENISVLHFVPSMLDLFLNESRVEGLDSLKHVICSGEALTPRTVERFYQVFKDNVALSNLYGPTEASIDVSFWNCSKNDKSLERIPIGKPITNTQLYIVNEEGDLCRAMEEGELLIGGVGLAKGYLNRPTLTSEKFIINPFGPGRLYRTGDRARYLEDGNIDFLGRLDNQVKLRGLRIELGEIESYLNKLAFVHSSVVILWNKSIGDDHLVAYIKLLSKDEYNEIEMHKWLEEKLPEYAVPSYFIIVEDFPLNANGKLDRKQLPLPNVSSRSEETHDTHEAGLLADLLGCWVSVLGHDNFEESDNFFDVGGSSLLLMNLRSELEDRFKIRFNILDLFNYTTPSQMLHLIQPRDLADSESIIELTDIDKIEKKDQKISEDVIDKRKNMLRKRKKNRG